MKLVSWAFLALLAIIVITLSVGNKDAVTFSLFPLPFVMDIPLYLLILGGALIGLVLGAFRTWLSDGKLRREVRELKRENTKLQGDLGRLNSSLKEKEQAAGAASTDTLKITDQAS